MSIAQFLQTLLFVLAIDLSGNLSYASSLGSLKIITVGIASYFFLNERSGVGRKVAATAISVLGLLLL